MSILRSSRRFLQTVRPSPNVSTVNPVVLGLSSSTAASNQPQPSIPTPEHLANGQASNGAWAKHSLPSEFNVSTKKKQTARPFNLAQSFKKPQKSTQISSSNNASAASSSSSPAATLTFDKTKTKQPASSASSSTATASTTTTTTTTTTAAKPKRKLRPRKAAIKLSPTAVEHLRQLLDQPQPQLIRVGVKNRGCSGLTYHLEYVDQPGKFDEEVVQDGVKVLIDSKALFSIIGSEMDWVDDKLSSRFVFNNPNSKGQCGCGESFMV